MAAATVVLMGRTGDGKSSLGNNLLGRAGEFPVGHGADSKTKDCKVATTADGRWRFIDTIGFGDTGLSQQEQLRFFLGFAPLALEGVHAFIFVLCGRWGSEIQAIFRILENMLGRNGLQRTLLVQTRVDTDPVACASEFRSSEVGKQWLPRFGGLECVDNKAFTAADRERLFAKAQQISHRFRDPWSNEVLKEAQLWEQQESSRLKQLPRQHWPAAAQKLEAWAAGRATRQEVTEQIDQAYRLHAKMVQEQREREAAQAAAVAATRRQEAAEEAARQARKEAEEAEDRLEKERKERQERGTGVGAVIGSIVGGSLGAIGGPVGAAAGAALLASWGGAIGSATSK